MNSYVRTDKEKVEGCRIKLVGGTVFAVEDFVRTDKQKVDACTKFLSEINYYTDPHTKILKRYTCMIHVYMLL